MDSKSNVSQNGAKSKEECASGFYRNNQSYPYGCFCRGAIPIIPIDDLNKYAVQYTEEEIQLRCKVAALYRLIDLHGWTDHIYNHISARANTTDEHFLINPFGLLYYEVTASSLKKVDVDGNVVDHGSTPLGINKAGFVLHSAIHTARPDVMCVIHIHTSDAIAVSVMKYGFLPMSQDALVIGDVSYHDYKGVLVDEEERKEVQRHLGPKNKIMFLRNHGIVACGSTVEEAYYLLYSVMSAIEAQVKAVSVGIENTVLVTNEDVKRKTYEIGNMGDGGGVDTSETSWGVGEINFEAAMRHLDYAGLRTGYQYKYVSSHLKAVMELTSNKQLTRGCVYKTRMPAFHLSYFFL